MIKCLATQGVALGWCVSAFQARIPGSNSNSNSLATISPKGFNRSAQGNALGFCSWETTSPERAKQIGRILVSRFQGYMIERLATQGVALGWYMLASQARIPGSNPKST